MGEIHIRDEVLAGHWYSFMHLLLGKVQAAFRNSGMTEAEIAKRIGRDRAFVSRCLKGEQNVTVRTLNNIVRAMGHRLDVTVHTFDEPPHD